MCLEDGWPEPRAHCRTRISSFDISAIWHLLLLSPHLISSRLLAAVSLFSSHLISPHLPFSAFGSFQLISTSHAFALRIFSLFSALFTHLTSSKSSSPHLTASQLFSDLISAVQFVSIHLISSHLAPLLLSSYSAHVPISSHLNQFFSAHPIFLHPFSTSSPLITVLKPKKQGGPENPQARWHTAHHFPESPSA